MSNDPNHSDQQQLEDLLAATLPVSCPDEQHYELADLTRLADARRKQGETWEMPVHLARCSLCLEAFEAILEGVAALSGSARKRFVAIHTGTRPAKSKILTFPAPWGMILKVAAVLAVLVGGYGLVSRFHGQPSAQVNAGAIALPNGRILPRGAGIPNGVPVTATEDTIANLRDGSQVELTKQTQVSFHESSRGETTIALTTGKVVASVAKQRPGNEFIVTTPLGNVTVVGTRFSVSCQSEDVVVYQSTVGETSPKQRPDVVRAMRVAVFAGAVRVQRQGEQVSVTANQMAVLRESEPGIEVIGGGAMTGKLLVVLALLGGAGWTGVVRAADPEEVQYNVVVTLYNAGQWQAAIKKIEEREKLELPDAMRARYLAAKGLAYEKGDKPAEARAADAALLAKYPQAPECRAARIALVHLDYVARDFDEVIKTYAAIDQTGLATADKRDLALMYAEALYTKDDPKAARAAYDVAIKLGADKSAVAGRLFDLYARLQLHKELVDLSANGVAGVDADRVSLVRAESLLALGRNAEAIAQAGQIPAASPQYPRAAFTRGLALVKSGKLTEAVEPLTVALEKLKDPPPPPAAYLTLAECLLESGKATEAGPYLAKAEKLANGMADAERAPLLKQIALVKLRQTIGGGSRKEMIASITKARDALPKDQVGRLLYMRLYALSEEGDDAACLQTMPDDYPVFQAGAEDGPATLIYFAALRKLNRADEGLKILAEFVQRKPAAPEAVRARLELANVALEKQDYEKAGPQLEAIRTAAGAETALGRETFYKVLFNRAVVADKLHQSDEALRALNQLIQAGPTNSLVGPAYVLLGQTYAVKNDFPKAAEMWQKALAAGGVAEADVRDRLGRVLFAAKNNAGACEQFEAEIKLLGGTEKLTRDSAEAFARARFAAGQFAAAGGLYEELQHRFRDVPAYAYECAVAKERDGQMAEAVKWYGLAQKAKDKLPPEYAQAVDANLANAQLQSGTGDRGMSHWIESLAPSATNAVFNTALAQLRKAGRPTGSVKEQVEAVMTSYGVTQPRYYDLGALLLQTGATTNAGQLAEEFSVNEGKLDPKSSGATLAPAIIYYFKGESARRAGRSADALAAYETILAAYPYNEWPDAAACGAAECYVALGDKATALVKFNEVVKSATNTLASAKWGEVAKQRISELNKGN